MVMVTVVVILHKDVGSASALSASSSITFIPSTAQANEPCAGGRLRW